ncbi:hypothetical protein QBC46DRAFT_337475 [Diplogelasinospora grovesii]|uniref:Uncharacterized protein n=1 Tax=Diplogelasinospora grovesii TaxID=303347 RepID=A0AAN6S8J1_9PEZI|nr:hypothetical protein QBC46DRAFT_337475 [Diplogelasinospora grovesii]
MAPLVWLVTGCTSGIGAALVHGIAARGDKVIATGRNASDRLDSIESDSVAVLDLGVCAPFADIQVQVARAVAIFGRIDVLVNNAGLSRMSTIEEASEEFVKAIFDVNLFGAMKVTQAVLSFLRNAGGGTVVFAALTMLAEGLQKEGPPLGIQSIIFGPGGFESNLAAPRDDEPFAIPPKVEDLRLFQSTFGSFSKDIAPKVPGDISKLPDAVVDMVKGEGLAKGRPFPVRVVLGPDSLDAIRQKCNEQLQLCDSWEDVALSVMEEGRRETSRWLLDTCSILNKS